MSEHLIVTNVYDKDGIEIGFTVHGPKKIAEKIDSTENAGVTNVGIFMDAAGEFTQQQPSIELEMDIPSVLL